MRSIPIPEAVDKQLRERAQKLQKQSERREGAGGGVAQKVIGERGEYVLERQLKRDGRRFDKETSILPGDKTGSPDYKTDFTVYVDGKPYRVDCKANERSAMDERSTFLLNATTEKDCALYLIVLVENKRGDLLACGEVLGAIKPKVLEENVRPRRGDHKGRLLYEIPSAKLKELLIPYEELRDKLDAWTSEDELLAYLERERAA